MSFYIVFWHIEYMFSKVFSNLYRILLILYESFQVHSRLRGFWNGACKKEYKLEIFMRSSRIEYQSGWSYLEQSLRRWRFLWKLSRYFRIYPTNLIFSSESPPATLIYILFLFSFVFYATFSKKTRLLNVPLLRFATRYLVREKTISPDLEKKSMNPISYYLLQLYSMFSLLIYVFPCFLAE